MEINIDINTECWNKCVFCSKKYSPAFDFWLEDLDELKNIFLKKINEEWDIYIWWQEPFNYSNLLKFLIFIKDNTDKKIIIKTSWIVNLKYINKNLFNYIDIIQIPCNSLIENDFNHIYWNQEAFKNYNMFLNRLNKYHIYEKLSFHTVVLKENYKSLADILVFLHRKFFIKKLCLVYPIRPRSEIEGYYDITISRENIINMYESFIRENIFELINFDKSLEYYEKQCF